MISPSSDAAAASAANCRPWSSSVISRMGPATTGRATRTPVTSGPQRRPARVESTTRDGASTSFSISSTEIILPQARTPEVGGLGESVGSVGRYARIGVGACATLTAQPPAEVTRLPGEQFMEARRGERHIFRSGNGSDLGRPGSTDVARCRSGHGGADRGGRCASHRRGHPRGRRDQCLSAALAVRLVGSVLGKKSPGMSSGPRAPKTIETERVRR